MAKIFYGVDAQPIGNMNWALSLGCNALHRYDSNGGKDTLQFWIEQARKRKLSYLIQGVACDQQTGYDYSQPDSYLIGISQDDEPDLNRYKANDPNNWAFIYHPGNPPPHPGMMGWTRPKILKDRYQVWRSRLSSNIPVTVNFAGPNLTNPYTQPTTSLHKLYYQPCSDQGGMDLYSENNDADRWANYGPIHAVRRLGAWGFNPVDAYFECSDQVLDGDPVGGKGRGPTLAEMANNLWGLMTVLGRFGTGVFSGDPAKFTGARIWAFPQRIGRNFTYEAVDDEHEQRIRFDFGLLKKYSQFIEEGIMTLVDIPEYKDTVGKQQFPSKGIVGWTLGDKVFQVEIDYSGQTLPIVTEPELEVVDWRQKYDLLSGELEALRESHEFTVRELEQVRGQLDVANNQLSTVNTKIASVKSILSNMTDLLN